VIYDRKTILSLKLASRVNLRKLSRNEFFTRMQVIRFLDPMTEEIWKEVENQRLVEQTDDSPHGNPWHVSFHASQFPGDDPMACPRQALYQMMDFPRGVFSRRSRELMAAGKAAEIELVKTYHEAGILISAPPDEEKQTGFVYEDSWLTGSVDCVIKPPNWNKPLPIEIKTKDRETIERMLIGAQGPDDTHIAQLKVQLALIALQQKEIWPGLDPVTHGYIYYLCRGDKKGEQKTPNAEFRVDLDMRFFEVGVARLKEWRMFFEEDVLPELNPTKRGSKFGHPNGWRWSYPPCNWCPFKKTCQLDFQAGETQLSQSVGINRAKLVREKYDPVKARERVKKMWNPKETK
jgi:CRISPR/Cas system-associated exonuclease Cas4 (RecB family)